MASHHCHRDQRSDANFRPPWDSDSFTKNLAIYFDYPQVPIYYEYSDEIDWRRPRHSWNDNQDYTYFNLFGRRASENFEISHLLASPEESADRDLFVHEAREAFSDAKNRGVDEKKRCGVCEKDEHKERIAMLECGHGHHVYCRQDWVRQWNVCPLCKSEGGVFNTKS